MPHRYAWFPVALLLALQTLLASYFLDNTGGANALSRAMPPVSWALFHTWAIDPLAHFTKDHAFVQNHAYTDKAPLSSWVITPFVQAARGLQLAFDKANFKALLDAIALGNILTGSLPFAVVTLILAARAQTLPPGMHPMLLAQALMYGTFLWAYAGVYFGHMLAAMWLLLATLCLRKERALAAGFLVGLAFLTEYPTAVALPLWVAQCAATQRWRQGVKLVTGFAPATALLATYNENLTGSPWTLTYKFVGDPQFAAMHTAYGFTWPQPDALFALVYSPQRGLLWFAPLLLLALACALRDQGAQGLRRAVLHPDVSVGATLLLLNASYFVWHGGECFGPRHLVVACVLWAYAAVPALMRPSRRRGVLGVAALTHLMTWMDKATRAHNLQPNETPFALWQEVGNLHFTDGALLTQLHLASPITAALVWPAVFGACTWMLCALFDQARRV